jgi:ATP-dependent Clp protease ATP-binding subunit ClpB
MRRTIRPEFLNRIDELIMFTPLNESEVKDIVGLQIERVKNKLAKNDIDLEVTEGAIDLISQLGFDPQFGARPVKRVIQRELLNKLSKEILVNNITKDKKVIIDRSGDMLIFKN